MRTRGFSLIETILVIFLFTLIMLAVVNVFLGFDKNYYVQNASINTSQTAAAIMDEVHRHALQASAVASSHAYSGTTYTSGTSTLVLTLPSIDSSGDIVSNEYDYAIFYLTGSTSYRILDADASSARAPGSKKLSDVVGDLYFTYDTGTPSSASRVTVDATTTSTVKGQQFQVHLQQTIYLRNI
jgi:Tfp pilus assembly protein PilV